MSRRARVILGIAITAVIVAVCIVVVPRVFFSDDEQTSAFDPSIHRSTRTPPPPDATTLPSDGGGDPSDGGGDPSTTPGTVSAADAEVVTTETTSLLDDVLPVVAPIDPDHPTDVVGELSDRADQAYLSELESEQLEFEAEGWSREGSFSVESVEVLDYSEDGDEATATVRACIDSSDLTITTADGAAVPQDPNAQRAWNVFVLDRTNDGTWRIVGRTFPHDPSC